MRPTKSQSLSGKIDEKLLTQTNYAKENINCPRGWAGGSSDLHNSK